MKRLIKYVRLLCVATVATVLTILFVRGRNPEFARGILPPSRAETGVNSDPVRVDVYDLRGFPFGPQRLGPEPGTGVGGGTLFPDPPVTLTELVKETVAPDSWCEDGGSDGRIADLGTMLVVSQTRHNQEAVRSLLTELRDSPPATQPWTRFSDP